MIGLRSTAQLPGWIPGFVLWFLRPRRSRGPFASPTGHDHAEPDSGDVLNRIAFDYDDFGQLESDDQVQIFTDVSSENRGGAYGGARRNWDVQKVHSLSLRTNRNEKAAFITN